MFASILPTPIIPSSIQNPFAQPKDSGEPADVFDVCAINADNAGNARALTTLAAAPLEAHVPRSPHRALSDQSNDPRLVTAARLYFSQPRPLRRWRRGVSPCLDRVD